MMIALYVIAYIVVGVTISGLVVRFSDIKCDNADDVQLAFAMLALWPLMVALVLPVYLGLKLFSVISGVKL